MEGQRDSLLELQHIARWTPRSLLEQGHRVLDVAHAVRVCLLDAEVEAVLAGQRAALALAGHLGCTGGGPCHGLSTAHIFAESSSVNITGNLHSLRFVLFKI